MSRGPARLAIDATRLVGGLILMGLAVAALKRSGLGLSPWDVLHDGIGRHLGVDLGLVNIGVGIVVLVAWWPLRQRPGPGTVLNVLLIGWVTHAVLPHWSAPSSLAGRTAALVAGLAVFALGQGLYLAAELGPGPRDGLMVALHRRRGLSIRAARTILEATVLVAGVALGGSVGVGTVAFALGMGPMVQVTLRWCGFRFGRVGATDELLGESAGDAAGLTGE